MILLLGATGYIGQAFADELRRRGRLFVPLTRKALDYTNFDILFDYVRKVKPSFLINAAGYTGRPNVDACESARCDTIQGNTLFPQMVARVCLLTRTAWGHVSSGCIYSGAKIEQNGDVRVEKDLSRPRFRQLFEEFPDRFQGFTEADEPNFSFRAPPCSFYSGTKALAEEVIGHTGNAYLWRLRIPFDEFDHPRNFLTKVQRYPRVYDNVNSLSHRGDFVRACLDLWERQAPFGIYNVTNPGAVTTRQVIELIQKSLKPDRQFHFWKNDLEFYATAAKTPRSNCILDVSKLLECGVRMRSIADALRSALGNWEPASTNIEMFNTFAQSVASECATLAALQCGESTPARPGPVA
jgi:dTDP-4-dehydrorhamnose reductase